MSDAQRRWELASIPDLLGRVPQLLGFYPNDSGVVVGVRDAYIRIVAWLELPTTTGPRQAAPPSADETAAVLHHIAAQCTADDVTDLVVLGYGEQAPVVGLFDLATAVFTVRGLTIMQLVRITGGHYVEHDPQHPNGTGAPAPFDPHTGPGPAAPDAPRLPEPDRAALAAAVAPQKDTTAAMEAALLAAMARFATADDDAAPVGRTAVEEAVRVSEQGSVLDDDDAAELLVLLHDGQVRDHALLRTAGDDQRHLQLWLDLTRRAAPGFVAAPACLAAFVAWQSHQPTLARLAVDRALHEDPGNRLGVLIHAALSLGAPPELARRITARLWASGEQQ
ncbi:DUF4192 domain-containing protein [Dactylosporangium cerinum]|uniref:DUF4192 domain-containing protein n=1 Tax=Dactylosporangium cerinum TaxID=1434730 RepID=A0ABV9WHR0_9ACTN